MRDRQTCVGCGKKSPETETNYTLISAQFGWRLTRYKGGDGALIVEWRCPSCWRDYKRTRVAPVGEPPSSRPSQPPPASLPPPPNPLEGFRARMPSAPGEPRVTHPITPVVPGPSRKSNPGSVPPATPSVPPTGRPGRGSR
jgi:hypothetical protein